MAVYPRLPSDRADPSLPPERLPLRGSILRELCTRGGTPRPSTAAPPGLEFWRHLSSVAASPNSNTTGPFPACGGRSWTTRRVRRGLAGTSFARRTHGGRSRGPPLHHLRTLCFAGVPETRGRKSTPRGSGAPVPTARIQLDPARGSAEEPARDQAVPIDAVR